MAVILCLVCSIIVSGAAVYLRPLQEANKADDRRRNILEVAGLADRPGSLEERFALIEARVVDLASGRFVTDIDPAAFDQRAASRDPATSEPVDADLDIASIKRQAHRAKVWFVRDEPGGPIQRLVLPVHGYGLWSTLYGFVSLQSDGRSASRLKFYEHAETPGLGGEVDNPDWRALWQGKTLLDSDGEPVIRVIRGNVGADDPGADYKVDGLAGATLTSKGVQNLMVYWLGEQGFGPLLERLRACAGAGRGVPASLGDCE